jgi:uncharacterized damage-inducible protein DinB
MIDLLLSYYDRNADYARRLVADVSDGQWCAQPTPGAGAGAGTLRNHAAWVIGHLTQVADKATGNFTLGLERRFPAGWDDLFHGKSQPTADRATYPDKAALMAAYEAAHARVADALRRADDSLLAKPTPHEGFRERFPTVGLALLHTMVGHECVHLGQLSAWRRALGLPNV